MNVPIPGARTVAQIEGIAGALAFGALPADVAARIEPLVERAPDTAPDRELQAGSVGRRHGDRHCGIGTVAAMTGDRAHRAAAENVDAGLAHTG